MGNNYPDSLMMFHFISYCKEFRQGNNGKAEDHRQYLRLWGYDIREIRGKWCLVDKDKEGNDAE